MYSSLRIANPPNVTDVNPLQELNMNGIFRDFGVLLVALSCVSLALSIMGIIGRIKRSERIANVVAVLMVLLMLVDITITAIYPKHDCHKRHHEFIANPLNVSNKERNNAGFGCDVHQYETIKYLEVKMNVDLVHYSVNPSKPYQFKKGVIKNLKNEKLLKILRTF